MSQDTIGWVMDKDTSKRRIHLCGIAEGSVGVVTEVDGQTLGVVHLDAEGVAALHTLVQRAILWCNTAGQEGA